ncbi:TIGR04013 family B12-binding domain/radical SAM domain-containing protein [Candidatus Sumerlaeota bacterium]|nr:TIGR04013 family B12-binding domain/radical SAM domain-containing protein [Candidatus Sumerlaeota bacterium]
MCRAPSLVFYRLETSRYALYALAGALESRRRFDELPRHFPHDEKDLLRQLDAIEAAGRRAVVAVSFPTACRDAIAKTIRSCQLRVVSGELRRKGSQVPSSKVAGSETPGSHVLGLRRSGSQDAAAAFPDPMWSAATCRRFQSADMSAHSKATPERRDTHSTSEHRQNACATSEHEQDARATRPFFIAGGAHPTALPEDALNLGFDLVAIGEGEATFVELVERFDQGADCESGDWRSIDFRSVAGIAWLDAEGRCVVNPARAPIDLDDYAPSPTRLQRFGHIEITRGCPFGCAFCQTSHIHGRRPRHRSVERVRDYVERMRRAGIRDVRFIAPDAFGYGSPDGRRLNVDALEELLGRVREAAGPEGRVYFGTFPSEVRPEHVTHETLALVRRYARNDLLVVGAQAGSDRLLEACGRGHTVEDVYAAVGRIRAAGLGASVDFIFGLPGETEEDRRQTARVMNDLAEMGARIHAHSFMPLPQTRFASGAPGRAEGEIREAANRLLSSGDLYGNWESQEGLARAFRRLGAEGAGG